MAKLPTHKWTPNTPDVVTLMYDTPFENKNDDGVYFTYTVKVNDVEHYCYASPDLHRMIKAVDAKKGDTISVTKYMEGGKFSSWHVTKDDYISVKQGDVPMNQTTPPQAQLDNSPNWDEIDRRKQLNIIAGQAMNLAVKYVMEKKGSIEDAPRYRDMFFKMMAEFVIVDPLKQPKDEKEDLPF